MSEQLLRVPAWPPQVLAKTKAVTHGSLAAVPFAGHFDELEDILSRHLAVLRVACAAGEEVVKV